MNHLRRLGSRISVAIRPDEHGFTAASARGRSVRGTSK